MKPETTERTSKIVDFDHKIRKKGMLCGIDEAGRGPVAGPVVAAAVIFGNDVFIDGVYDSKKLTARRRSELYSEITQEALGWSVGIVDNKRIDEVNILNATRMAMDIAVSKLKVKPATIIADGNFYGDETNQAMNIIRGDELSFTVAAASIIAKVTRDLIMADFQNNFPNFTFSVHKGYCTPAHIEEIIEYGYTDIHRRSFRLKAVQMSLL